METKFGVKQITTETPQWAKWMFRIAFILTTATTFIVASDPAISDDFKVRLGVYLKGLDMIIFGISKMFGVEKYETTQG